MVNVTFDFQDSTGNEIFSRITISPAIAPIAYGTSIVSSDSVIVLDAGTINTVPLAPNVYNVHLSGKNTSTEFLITVPSQAEGTTVNAKDYLASVIPTINYNAVSASYAQFANTASYALTALSASYAPNPLPDVTDDIGNSVSVATSLYVNGDFNVADGGISGGTEYVFYNFSPEGNNSWINAYGGNVGIGTTSPQATLDVNGNIANSNGDLNIDNFGSSVTYIGDVQGFNGSAVLAIDGVDSYFLFNNGYVGINTPTPNFNLDVYGTIGNSAGDTRLESGGGVAIIGTSGAGYAGINGAGINNGSATSAGVSGVIFENSAIGLCDFAWAALDNHGGSYVSTVRFETRGGFVKTGGPELQFGSTNIYIPAFGYQPNIFLGPTYSAVSTGMSIGQGMSPSAPATNGLTVVGSSSFSNIDFTGTLTKSGTTYVPASATSASYATTMPYSSSLHAFTPVAATGSHYLQVNASTQFLFVHNGTRWTSASLA